MTKPVCLHIRTTKSSRAAQGATPGIPAPGTMTTTCDDCGDTLLQEVKK